MYKVDRRPHRHRRTKRGFFVVLTLLIASAVIYGITSLRIAPTQELDSSPPISKSYSPAVLAKVSIDKPEFTMELPTAWKEVSPGAGSTAPSYSFRSPSEQAQLLDIYMGVLPQNMALNKAIVVGSQGSGLSYDSVSDNCSTFTEAAKTGAGTANVQSRWRGASFICDMANPLRAVVGAVSTEGVNKVTVVGDTIGRREIFITYTDNSINPDYSVLYSVLGSIHFK